MEKLYYLNASNTKYVRIGIKPATRLFNNDFQGFFVEATIDGKNMRPMALNGLDGFLNLCRTLRQFDELKFTYPCSADKYDDVDNALPLNISKKPFNGCLCFCIETITGGTCMIAQNSCAELLKNENLIAAAIRKFELMTADVEKKFNEIVLKSSDFAEMVQEAVKSGDLLSIETLMNCSDYVWMNRRRRILCSMQLTQRVRRNRQNVPQNQPAAKITKNQSRL